VYVIGNPPYLGAILTNDAEQKKDMDMFSAV
jgi:hypothetical protein